MLNESKRLESCPKCFEKLSLNNLDDLQPLGEVTERKHVIMCSEHALFPVDTYCSLCNKAVCAQCAVRKHNGHTFIPMEELALTTKKNLEASADKLLERISDLKTGSQGLEQTMEQLQANKLTAEEAIAASFRKTRVAMDQREAQLLGKVEQLFMHRKKRLNLQKDEHIFVQERIQAVHDFTKGLGQEGNDAEILMSEMPLTERIDRLIQLTVITKPLVSPDLAFSAVNEAELLEWIDKFGDVIVKGTELSPSFSTVEKITGLVQEEKKENQLELGKSVSFELHGKGEDGQLIEDSLEYFEITLDGPSQITKPIIKNIEAGIYSVLFQPDQIGEHQITIKLGPETINNSPIQFTVAEPLKKKTSGTAVKNSSSSQPIFTIGQTRQSGNGDGIFNNPTSVAFNAVTKQIIVGDGNNNRVQVFDTEGKFLFKFGSKGSSAGQFSSSYIGLATNSAGNIYVSDMNNHRIQIFNSKGEFQRSVGSKGNQNSQFNGPWGLWIDKKNNADRIYVTEWHNNRVQAFDKNFNFITKFGLEGGDNGQFYAPCSVVVNSKGHIFIADNGNQRVQEFDGLGKFIKVIGAGQLSNPYGLAISATDELYVGGYNADAVKVFDKDGKFVKEIGKGSIDRPFWLAIDGDGRILVCNYNNHNITFH